MGNADLHGAGSFRYPTADEYEAALLASIRRLANESAKLARAAKDSEAAVAHRDRVEQEWERITRDLAVLRAQERRETKLVARDLLHARLSGFLAEVRASSSPTPVLTWESTFKNAILWLTRWSGSRADTGLEAP